MSAQKYRKKPVEIEAVQYDGQNYDEILGWIDGAEARFTPAAGDGSGSLVIATLEGELTVSPGDFVIRGVQGEFYPCKPDIFAATYDEGPARPRTALGLGSFYKELLEEGIPQDLAYEVVRDAARPLTDRDGICVKASTSGTTREVSA